MYFITHKDRIHTANRALISGHHIKQQKITPVLWQTGVISFSLLYFLLYFVTKCDRHRLAFITAVADCHDLHFNLLSFGMEL